jgi:hypothetical protein
MEMQKQLELLQSLEKKKLNIYQAIQSQLILPSLEKLGLQDN